MALKMLLLCPPPGVGRGEPTPPATERFVGTYGEIGGTPEIDRESTKPTLIGELPPYADEEEFEVAVSLPRGDWDDAAVAEVPFSPPRGDFAPLVSAVPDLDPSGPTVNTAAPPHALLLCM